MLSSKPERDLNIDRLKKEKKVQLLFMKTDRLREPSFYKNRSKQDTVIGKESNLCHTKKLGLLLFLIH